MEVMDIIYDYLVNENGFVSNSLPIKMRSLMNHEDIMSEFARWIQSDRSFNLGNPLMIEGYTAANIHEMAPFLSVLGVFNFMVTLRERPMLAKSIIDKGFPVE